MALDYAARMIPVLITPIPLQRTLLTADGVSIIRECFWSNVSPTLISPDIESTDRSESTFAPLLRCTLLPRESKPHLVNSLCDNFCIFAFTYN